MSVVFRSVQPIGAFAFGLDVPKLRLDYTGLVVLQGENGSGKSSIMNAVCQGVFGKNDTSGKGDEIANVVLKEGCCIKTEFEVDGVAYSTECARRFKRPGSTARVTDQFLFGPNGEDLREENMDTTFASICSKLGMDFEQFRATSYLGVKSAPKFLHGTDSERMGVITPFLNLGVWDRAQIAFREDKKAALDELASTRGKYDQVKALWEETSAQVLTDNEVREAEAHIAEMNQQLAVAQAEIDRVKASSSDTENRLRVLEADLVKLQAERDGYDKTLRDDETSKKLQLNHILASQPKIEDSQLPALTEKQAKITHGARYEREALKTELAQVKKLTAQTCELPEVAAAFAEGAALDQKLSSLRVAIDQRDVTLERMPVAGMGECPTCLTAVDAVHLARKRAEIEAERDAMHRELEAAQAEEDALHQRVEFLVEKHRSAEVARITAELADLDEDEKTALDEVAKAIVVENMRQSKIVQSWQKKRADALNAEFKKKSEEVAAKRSACALRFSQAQKEVAALRADPRAVANRAALQDLENLMASQRDQIQGVRERLSESRVHAADAERHLTSSQELAQLVGELEAKIDDLEFLDLHVGDKGIKRDKLRGHLDFMNAKLAEYMSIMGLPLEVWFQDRVLKKASSKKKPELLTDDDYTDKFDVLVADGLKRGVPLGLYSGGESTLISLAILGVLWETSNLSGRGGSNLFMVDEPFALLREDNRDRALALLEYWGSLGKCVIVSDNSQAVDSIGRRASTWTVVKTNHVSTVEVCDG